MRKHKPPSQVRYEKEHPTVSFRIDRETKNRLREVQKEQSIGNFIKEALGIREREKESLENRYDEGYSEGYREGYDEAVKVHGIYGDCMICGRKILVSGEKVKEGISNFLRDKGLYHMECKERIRY